MSQYKLPRLPTRPQRPPLPPAGSNQTEYMYVVVNTNVWASQLCVTATATATAAAAAFASPTADAMHLLYAARNSGCGGSICQ